MDSSLSSERSDSTWDCDGLGRQKRCVFRPFMTLSCDTCNSQLIVKPRDLAFRVTPAFQACVTISSRKLTACPMDRMQAWSHLVGPTEKYQSSFIVCNAQQKSCIFHKLSSSSILPLSYLSYYGLSAQR